MDSYEAGYIIGVVIGSVVMGVVVGLIPYFMAKKRGRKNFGIISLLLCVLANFIGGLLVSVPVCVVELIVLFVLDGKKKESSGTAQTNYTNSVNNRNNYTGTVQTPAYCTHCGAPVDATTVYCTNCGNKVK